MQQNIRIRLAKDEDFDTIYSIWLEGIGNSFDYDKINMEDVKRKFANNFFHRNGIFNFWVAVNEYNTIVGWQSLIKCLSHPIKEDVYAESSTE